jgi:predicted transcriptional regulator of viral defense system
MDFFTLYRTLDDLGLEIFTVNDVVKITGQRKAVVINTLARWVKQGKILRLKNQYYSLKGIENKFLFQRLFLHTYIGLYSALEYYGSTTQRFTNLDLITNKVLKDQTVENIKVNFHKVKKNLFFGFTKVKINQTEVFISNIEKTILDCTYFSSKVYLSEINMFILSHKDQIDTTSLVSYLNRINSPVLNKRVGYLLEKNGLSIDNITINNKYDRLNINLESDGARDNKWKLIINENL